MAASAGALTAPPSEPLALGAGEIAAQLPIALAEGDLLFEEVLGAIADQ